MSTVVLVMSDVVGSTALWEAHGEAMRDALELHDQLVQTSVTAAGGRVFKHTGDGMIAAFDDADAALTAARNLIDALATHEWGPTGPLQIRVSMHAGQPTTRDGDYFGPPVNRVARINAVAQPGQILASQVVRDLLRRPTGTDLGEHQLKDLGEPLRLWQLDDAEHPPLTTLQAELHNLPRQSSEFIGRDAEVAELVDLLSRSSRVTITGVGGCGKTRIALEVAATVSNDYPGGAWFVDLTHVVDADGVAPACVSAIAITAGTDADGRQPSAWDTLTDYLAQAPALLVLDNCEHMVDIVAEFVEDLGRSSPATTVLSTSREALAIDGERVWRIPTMTADAVALFVSRAQAADASFSPTADDLDRIAEICTSLDGIPLAVELAAARTTMLPVADLAGRLDDRFALLGGSRRARRQRQQTLQAMMDWSWELLDADEQRLLQEVAVFSGGFGLNGVDAVCSPPGDGTRLDVLQSLIDKSLVAPVHGEVARFRLLETVRLYALDKVLASGRIKDLRDAHLEWVYSICEHGLPSEVSFEVLQRELSTEYDNLMAALRWADERDQLAAWPLLTGWHTAGVWVDLGRSLEGIEWFDAMAARATAIDDPIHRAGVLAGRSMLLWFASLYDRSAADTRAVIDEFDRLGDTEAGHHLLGMALLFETLNHLLTGQFDDAWTAAERALALQTAEAASFAWGSYAACMITGMTGAEPETTLGYADDVIEARGWGPTTSYAAHLLAGMAHMKLGNGAEALTHAHRAVDAFVPYPNSNRLAVTHEFLAWMLALDGRVDEAIDVIDQMPGRMTASRRNSWESGQILALTAVLHALGDSRAAAGLFHRRDEGGLATLFHRQVSGLIEERLRDAIGDEFDTIAAAVQPATDQRALVHDTIEQVRGRLAAA